MSRFVYDPSRPKGQRFVEVPVDWRPAPRSQVAIHGVKAPFKSMADGLYYTDTRTYEREVRARGCEIVGNDIAPYRNPDPPKMKPVEQDILRAAEEINFSW